MCVRACVRVFILEINNYVCVLHLFLVCARSPTELWRKNLQQPCCWWLFHNYIIVSKRANQPRRVFKILCFPIFFPFLPLFPANRDDFLLRIPKSHCSASMCPCKVRYPRCPIDFSFQYLFNQRFKRKQSCCFGIWGIFQLVFIHQIAFNYLKRMKIGVEIGDVVIILACRQNCGKHYGKSNDGKKRLSVQPISSQPNQGRRCRKKRCFLHNSVGCYRYARPGPWADGDSAHTTACVFNHTHVNRHNESLGQMTVG